MGQYLQTDSAFGKVNYLKKHCGATDAFNHKDQRPPRFDEIPAGLVLVCVVTNPVFEAAGVIFDQREYDEFTYPDPRPKHWLYMDRDKAIEMCPTLEAKLA